jgi:hypothetical protein
LNPAYDPALKRKAGRAAPLRQEPEL